jgi:hypothetical protein
MIALAANCARCGGSGLLLWGTPTLTGKQVHWFVPCPQCRPDEPQHHPRHPTRRLGDGTDTPHS